jgi:hypothetical protein
MTGSGGTSTGMAGGPGGNGGRGGAAGRGGATGTAGSAGTAGSGGGAGRGGATGTAGSAGTAGAGGGSNPTGAGGSSSTTTAMLDCGTNGYVVENHGPPSNRVNYVIVGDGYQSADLMPGGPFETHIKNAMARRFSQNAQPFLRYRNFINICGIKVVSTGKICSGSALGCCGSDSSRLANCDNTKATAVANGLPKTLTIDWMAIMLNGSSWWNSGGWPYMYFSGGNSDAPGAALHEGGHSFIGLADEYGTCTGGGCGMNTNFGGAVSADTTWPEINNCKDPTTTDDKWMKWMGYNQTGATGIVSTFSNSRYRADDYRPTDNSMMNSLFCGSSDQTKCIANTAYNAVSREEIVMTIWKRIRPIDSTDPAAGAVTSPGVLKVNVIDPMVINVDWTVDGTVTKNGGTTFDTSTLAAGAHTISATAYDNAGDDLVRYKDSTCPTSQTKPGSSPNPGYNFCKRTGWKNSTQTVMWTFTK